MSQKGLSTIGGILIALLIAAVAAVGVWTYYTLTTADITNSESSSVVTTTNNNANITKDWKTAEFGSISYKYPKEWTFETGGSTDIVRLKTDKMITDTNGKETPIILQFSVSTPTSSADLSASVKKLSETGTFTLSNSKTRKIGSVDALTYTVTLSNQSKGDAVFFIYKDKLYEVLVTSGAILTEKDLTSFNATLNQVLSTITLGTAKGV